MRVKDHNKVSSWNFFMEDMSGETVQVPPQGGTNTIQELLTLVLSYIQTYDNHTNNEYSKQQRIYAEEDGLSFNAYMIKLIEHQFCLRNSNTTPCWSGGVGDTIHNALTKVDGWIEHTPEVLQQKVQAAISFLTPSKSKTFGGCSVCGGSKVMSRSSNNLGRAGKLNNI
jgi:hypothetical protein